MEKIKEAGTGACTLGTGACTLGTDYDSTTCATKELNRKRLASEYYRYELMSEIRKVFRSGKTKLKKLKTSTNFGPTF